MNKKLFFLPVVLGCCLLTGCWDKIELDDRNYVLTLGIDKYNQRDGSVSVQDGENNRFTVSIGTAELQKSDSSGGGSEEGTRKTGLLSGNTLPAAMKLYDMFNSRQTFYGQTKAIILGESLLKDEKLFREALDALERDQEISMQTIVMATKDKASDSVEAVTTAEEASGLYLWDFYKNNAKESGASKKLEMEELMIRLRNSQSVLIPLVKLEDEELSIGGCAVIKDFEICGYLDEQQERGTLWLEGDADGAIVEANVFETEIPMRVLKNKRKLTFGKANDNIICHIGISIDGNIEGFYFGENKLFQKDAIEEIEKAFAEKIAQEASGSLTLLQEGYGVDALGFLQELKKRNFKLYQKYSGNETGIYKDMDFDISVDVTISGIGMIQ